jgi:hypothetical protein
MIFTKVEYYYCACVIFNTLRLIITFIKLFIKKPEPIADDLVSSDFVSSDFVSSDFVSEDTPIIVKDNWHIVVMPSAVKGKYYVGLVLEAFDGDELVLSIDLIFAAELFYRFPIERAKDILKVYAEYDDDDSALLAHNMCTLLGLRDGSVSDVYEMPLSNKTYWIRIIQRRWRRVCRENLALLRMRGGLANQRRFELTGKYGLPILRGIKRLFVESEKI